MPRLISPLTTRLALAEALAQHGAPRVVLVATIHLAALALMAWSEVDLVGRALFLLTWGLLNFSWLAILRRPGLSALLSLAMVALLVVLSRFKSENLWMTVSFLDIMIIDADTIAFLLTVVPHLRVALAIAIVLAVPLSLLVWRLDPFRVGRRTATLGAAACFAGIVAVSIVVPEEPWQAFVGDNYLSKFVRSGVTSTSELATHGLFDAGGKTTDRLTFAADDSCQPSGKPPHVIMVLDESSFDIRAVSGVKVPAGYGSHFRSFDGATRSFVVEGAGGPTWYAEYNVLTGLSTRSFGRFAYFVTRIAAGRIERGLPQALRRCGYKTFTLYPVFGAFLGARSFQRTIGVERFIDAADMGSRDVEPDRFYYERALRLIGRERGSSPLFLFVYLTANHFPWTYPFRAELTPDWRGPGNAPEVDEYIRRQMMSVRDYGAFVARLKQDFPGRVVPAGAVRGSPAEFRRQGAEPRARRCRDRPAHHGARSALLHHLLRGRCRQFPPGRHVVRAARPRRALSAAGGPGGRRPAARSHVPRAEAHPAALRRRVLRLWRRRRGPPLQPPPDRRRPHQAPLIACALRGASTVGPRAPRRVRA